MMVEVIIASSIILVSVLAAMSVAQKSIVVSHQALHISQAGFLLEEGAENMRIARDDAWSNVATLSSEQKGIFTRTVVASGVCRNLNDPNKDDISSSTSCGGTTYSDSHTKLITVTVSWVEGGQTITKTLPFYLADIFS